MNKKTAARHLTKNLLFTLLISCGLTFLAIQIIYSEVAGSLEGNSGIAILTIAGFFWTLVLTVSSLTVFFNVIDNVRHNLLISILTFYFLPSLVTIIFYLRSDYSEMWSSFFIITGLYFLTHTYFFVKLRRLDIDKNADLKKIDEQTD